MSCSFQEGKVVWPNPYAQESATTIVAAHSSRNVIASAQPLRASQSCAKKNCLPTGNSEQTYR
jgi:hypothetical protein